MRDVGLQCGYVKFSTRSHCGVIRAWKRIAGRLRRSVGHGQLLKAIQRGD